MISTLVLLISSMETKRTTVSEFPNGGKVIGKEILASEDRKKIQKCKTVRVVDILKSSKSELSYALVEFFNMYLREYCFLDCWKVSSCI